LLLAGKEWMMTTLELSPSSKSNGPGEIKQHLRRLDRKDAWFWWNAVLVITLLMGAIVALSLPTFIDESFHEELAVAVRGLLGLVLIFNIYTLYQQYLLRQLRRNLADQIQVSTEQKVRAQALYDMAILDPLTGLYNRRYSEERLKSELARAERSGVPVSVLMFDLDKFKEINDRFGHHAGDQVLKEFAHRLTKATRGSDFAVRTGGDEFLLFLSECPPGKVELVLSRLTPLEFDFGGQKVCVTSSQGRAQCCLGETADELLRRVDHALYTDKRIHRSEILRHEPLTLCSEPA
jgi:diguanylate cyclase (GGDEF)-like protein